MIISVGADIFIRQRVGKQLFDLAWLHQFLSVTDLYPKAASKVQREGGVVKILQPRLTSSVSYVSTSKSLRQSVSFTGAKNVLNQTESNQILCHHFALFLRDQI